MSESKGMSLASHPHLCQFGASGGGSYALGRRRGREADGARTGDHGRRLPADGRRAGPNPLLDGGKFRRP